MTRQDQRSAVSSTDHREDTRADETAVDDDIYAICAACDEIEDPITSIGALERFEDEHEASCGPDAPLWVHGLERLWEEAGIEFTETVVD